MEQLKELLDYAVTHAAFDIGRADRVYPGMLEYIRVEPMTRVYPSGFQIGYASRPKEMMTAQQLREFACGDIWSEPDIIRARKALTTCPDDALSPLEHHLRILLKDYMDPETNRVGHAFPNIGIGGPTLTAVERSQLCNIAGSSSLNDFAKALVKGGPW